MTTKSLIAALIGAIILFVYQALSWGVLPMHQNSFKHATNQDVIMTFLSQHLNEDGYYALPMPAADATMDQKKDFINRYENKPEAMISYHKTMHGDMASNMIVGFAIDFIAALVVALIIAGGINRYNTFGKRLAVVLAFAVFLIMQAQLMEMNWFQMPWHYISGGILDVIIGWVLAGIWLAWYMGRGKKRETQAT